MMYKKRLALKVLMFSLVLTNIPVYSFANKTSVQQNKYIEEISDIETKEDLQKSAQKAVKSGEVDTWITGLANMPTARGYLTSAVVGGKIYCIGGNGNITLNSVQVYDPETDTWETKTPMPTAREVLTSTVVDGKIYCIGGYDGSSWLNTVEVYDPETDIWETKASMPTARSGLISEVINGKIYCIGGNNSSAYYNTLEVYDPATNKWEIKTPMPTSRAYLASAVVDGKIYCIGGFNVNGSVYYNKVEVYDPETDSWGIKANMPTARGYLTGAVVGGKIYCIGGKNGSTYLNVVEVYDLVTDSWEIKTPMPTSRAYLASAVVDGKIYCVGGNNGLFLNKVEAYVAFIPPTEEEIAEEAVFKAEQSKDLADISDARDLVNKLHESSKKDELNDRLDSILPNIAPIVPQSVTGNSDIYIKMKNVLSLSLDTNSVTFEDFSGVEDMEKLNAVNLTVESSLPYEVNAFLETEIQNTDKTETLDKSILGIRANGDVDYKSFASINTPLNLLDSQETGRVNVHGIDLKLNKNVTYKTDVYKAVIKFEVKQK